ncbi:LLM class flavin-dependent oxidoreductase [Marinomonas rhizomae]|uniref:FMN-dependent oxidoreductase (Nitrilotriacetate monooxygenase family) n=1 Tax=Marinomonas rhizomae TaxID=491948 RepID=A0A366JGV1_9GAMM|nr:NtaA/DmoA family FMN-dependent monooxygenase [Marinomonas rhizomae]RBP85710.1 FMN-dependent oxidoreductase (nitrilotriacetate monooxygenase family) [Marinomonas rhizomae]RNF75666.1 LLM class flavin-dependent oxidoreductase [Marinomonas rhizomae]
MSQSSIHIGLALVMGWLSANGWRRDNSQVEQLFNLQPYLDLAKQAEQAKLDFVFRPDTLFLKTAPLATEPGFSNLDPFVLLSAIASHTQKIGLVATASTTFLPPYVVARQLQSLHWLSQGRAGWNLVTAIEGQQNFGESPLSPSKQRYEKAQEHLEVVQKLWHSYPNSSLKMDKHSKQFADIEQVQPIQHTGEYFHVKGPLSTPATPFGDIPLFQAGASDQGRAFAAKVASAVFAATPDLEAGIELRQDLRKRAAQLGRDPNEIKVLPGLSLYLAETRKEAETCYRDTHAGFDLERRYAYVEEAIGLNLREYDDHHVLTETDLPELTRPVRSQTHSNLMRQYIIREHPSVNTFLQRPEVCGSSHWLVIGTAEDAVDSIIERISAGAADGFIAIPGGHIQSAQLFFEKVMPALAEQGWFRREYQGTTLVEHLNESF